MAARMDETRLANLGHQERCSRGDSVTALSGAQTLGAQGKQECLSTKGAWPLGSGQHRLRAG